MEKMTCVIVDDEHLARSQLMSLIQEDSRLEVIGQADRKLKAIELIDALRPELVFLDVRMPGGGGFEIVSHLAYRPKVIFVTAHDEYAVGAFEINAIDYLLKPVSIARLQVALDRVCTTNNAQRQAVLVEDRMIAVGGAGKYISLKDILYVQSEGHYTKVVVEGGEEHQIRQPLREWIAILPESLFLKVERSILINTNQIVTANLSSGGGKVQLGNSRIELELGGRASQRLNAFLRR